MDPFPTKTMSLSVRKEMLKKDVIYVLSQHPEGLSSNKLWELIKFHTGRVVSAKNYGVIKMSNILREWADIIQEFGPNGQEKYSLKKGSHQNQQQLDRNKTDEVLALDDDEFPVPKRLADSNLGRVQSNTQTSTGQTSTGQTSTGEVHVEHAAGWKAIGQQFRATSQERPQKSVLKPSETISAMSLMSGGKYSKSVRNTGSDYVDLTTENAASNSKESHADVHFACTSVDSAAVVELLIKTNLATTRKWIMQFFKQFPHNNMVRLSKLKKFLQKEIEQTYPISGDLLTDNEMEMILNHLKDLVNVSYKGPNPLVGILNPESTRDQSCESTGSEESIGDDNNTDRIVSNQPFSIENIDVMKSWVRDFIAIQKANAVKLEMLKAYIREKFRAAYGVKMGKLKKAGWLSILNDFNIKVVYEGSNQPMLVIKNDIDIPVLHLPNRPTAMTVMSTLSGWGKPAGTMSHATSTAVVDLTNDNQNCNTVLRQDKRSVPSFDFISLSDDEKSSCSKTETIHLIEDGDTNSNPEIMNSGMNFQGNLGQSLAMSVPMHTPGQPMFREALLNMPVLGQYGVAPNAVSFAQLITTLSPSTSRSEPSLPGFRDAVIDLTTNPIEKRQFEKKMIDVRPVYIPKGQYPSRELVDNLAKECIEMLADANEFVSFERVEKLVCQRLCCSNIRQIGFQYIDQVPCVNELNRLICKINAYILSFVKTRSICTLYELKEALRDYEPNKGEFANLKVGPLQRFPLVLQQFRFPPNQAEIPEITSMDILDHFHNYLTINQLWSKRLELEPFMNYLVEQYSADNAYMLGVRIRSLPLAAAVLKKAQRDTGNNRREIVEHFKQNLKNEIEEAFRKFRANILQTGTSEGMEVRTHYLKMRPELAVLEVFEKFNVLMTVTQVGENKHIRSSKLSKAIQDFIKLIKDDELGKSLLHLAICITNTALEQSALALLAPQQEKNSEDAGSDTRQTNNNKPPPVKGTLVESLKRYIERCLNAGSLTLTHLDRIEEKLLEDFDFQTFYMMGYGRFLEFLVTEAKQVLEENGGLALGSGSGSAEGDVSFKPQQADIMEFIRQCKQNGHMQPTEIEDAMCRQYNVKEIRHLGHGNIARLLAFQDKHGHHAAYGGSTVYYESTLVPSVGGHCSSGSKVGILGHQTKDAAKSCLHNCPLLENLADWSQWGLVFEPEHGKLKDFIQKFGGSTTKTMEGGRLVTLDFMALELKPGELIKIVSTTSPEHVVKALEQRNVIATSGHLVSMAVSFKGVNKLPMALLSGHVKTALLQMHASESSDNQLEQNVAAMFVLQCLLKIPTKICMALANQLFLDPLGQVVGSTKSKQLLPHFCKTVEELNQLIELGCLLGIQEWTNLTQQKCVLPDSAIEILPRDIEEFLQEDDLDQECEEEAECSDDTDTEDVDEILAGDDRDKAKVMLEEVQVIKEEKMEDVIIIEDKEGKEQIVNLDDDIVMLDSINASESPSCEDIVNQIRKEEFGVGVHLGEDGQRLMKVQQERLGRSLDRLSKDLYSKDTHFVLELIQNADDNNYHGDLLNNTIGDCPSVNFIIDTDSIQVMNNELGFQEKDIRALCDVGRSTKGKHKFGYIGQKGIGFKSVFRITDAPEVHSNGYHIKFDVNSGPMGYIQPHWIPETEQPKNIGWMTQIILRLKTDMRLQTRTLAARFNDIHPSLLLFLHRLRQITIENKMENTVQMIRRRDVGNDIIEIEHSDGCERWLVIKKMLDASKISLQAKSGADVESTEIALAFPVRPQGQKSLTQALPPKQPVFAFLPLRSYGFRFIIQGDFDVPSSREDVDRDSPWNQWLRNEIHTLFIDALDIFKNHPEFTAMEAVCMFLQFVPMEDEILDFFKPVSSDILKKLKARPCVPTQPNSQGVISWKIPSQTVRVRDSLIRSVITADLLQKHLNLYYLHNDVASMLNPTLTSCLGIETLTSEHLYQLGHALIVQIGTHCGSDEDVILISKWLACMYRSLDEFHHDDTILTKLKALKMLPLSDGELVAQQDKTVFYPIPDSAANSQRGKDPVYYLQQDINSLHPVLLKTGDDEVNSQVHKFLLRLGIKQLSPFDIINHHIIPVLKSDSCKTKSAGTLISYLIFIKEQTDKQASVCNLDELKSIAIVMTNQGPKIPSQEPVHFPPQYGTQINLQQVFSGYDWTLLNKVYLPDPCTPATMISYHDFFVKLGVEDFLSVKKREVHLKKEELSSSPWCILSEIWSKEETEFNVEDYYSPELEGLIKYNKNSSEDVYISQMRNLFIYMDRQWESKFSKYCGACVKDKEGKPLRDTDTSFSILLRTADWLPAVETLSQPDVDNSIKHVRNILLKQPATLYIKGEAIEKLLSDKVLYLDVPLTGGSFCQFLGLKNSVSIDLVKEHFLKWGERSSPNVPSVFCTSLQHMKNVYTFLNDHLQRKQFQELLREKYVYFVPNKSVAQGINASEVCAGKMLSRNEIWLADKTGLFDKYIKLLTEFHSEICRKRTIASFYSDKPDIIEIFGQEGKVDVQPKVEEYIELLGLLCTTSTPKDTQIFSDVLYIFTIIGQALVTPLDRMPDEQTSNITEVLKSTVKKLLWKQKVFPTKKHLWVSLGENPMLADNRDWERMFANKDGVHFLDLEDKERGKVVMMTGPVQRFQRLKAESRIKQDKIAILLDVCEVKKLSEVVKITTIPDMIEPCLLLQHYFHQIVPVIQQYLMVRFQNVYQLLEQRNTRAMLKDAQFYQAGKLEVTYRLSNMVQETFEVKEEKCVIEPPTFYFHREHLLAIPEINREVSRYFSSGNTDCNTSLRSFLSEVASIVSSKTDDTMVGLLQRHSADEIVITAEDMWHVEAPVIPEPEPEPELMPVEIMSENQSVSVPDHRPAHNDGEMRAWPPVSSDVKGQKREKSDRPASSIWPPPQARDYMKSVKELPLNIRMAAPGERGETSVGEQGDASANKVSKDDVDSKGGTVHGHGTNVTSISGQPGHAGHIHIEQQGVKVLGTSGQSVGHPAGGSADGHVTIVTRVSEGQTASQRDGLDVGMDKNRKRMLSEPDEGQCGKRHSGHNKMIVIDSEGRDSSNEGQGTTDNKRDGSHAVFGKYKQQQTADSTHQHSGIQGEPKWTQMASEYTFDDLELGTNIEVPVTLNFEQNMGDPEIGYWGEALVAEYLKRQKDIGNILDFIWKNKTSETGCPYDFEVHFADENGIHVDYIEVKSTVSDDKEVFEISVQQIKFADEKKENFHIYRVFNAGNTERVRLIRITNLDMRLSQKQVKLCMLI